MSLSSIYPLSKVVRPAHRARATAPNHFPIVPTGDIARAFCEHRAAEAEAAGGLDDRDHPTIAVPLDRHDGDPGAHQPLKDGAVGLWISGRAISYLPTMIGSAQV